MFLLRTGIPSLDELLHRPRESDTLLTSVVGDHAGSARGTCGIALEKMSDCTSLCIAGPDGTGKSVLAMHLASRYVADLAASQPAGALPLVLYVSTDLSHETARAMWQSFSLNRPNDRPIPFLRGRTFPEKVPDWLARGKDLSFQRDLQIDLVKCDPANLDALATTLSSAASKPQVCFVDLASTSAGDDWGFVQRLMATLSVPVTNAGAPHLIILDAVEGLETFGGELDAFGQTQSRRARVARIMRLAARRAHVVLIVEEPVEGEHLAEQFVTDVVMRLRTREDHGYTRRTLEVEKSRGQAHVRGRHPYVIQSGYGSTTGTQQNFDDPFVRKTHENDCQSYVEVFPSIHLLSRRTMQKRSRGRIPAPTSVAAFGIEHLDDMLAEDRDWNQEDHPKGGDRFGIPASTVTALMGDANTQKLPLGIAFLGHAFEGLIDACCRDTSTGSDREPVDSTLSAAARAVGARREQQGHGKCDPAALVAAAATVERLAAVVSPPIGVAVLVTTHDRDHSMLVESFMRRFREHSKERKALLKIGGPLEIALTAFLERRTICRRLEIHDTPAAMLFHIIRRTVEAAQQVASTHLDADPVWGAQIPDDASQRFEFGARIRLVIDDFRTIMDTYATIRQDPLFVPFLLFYLRREGLTTLIIDTQPGVQPATALREHHAGRDADLRVLTDSRIYTWHVTAFFGDQRIAIAAIPPLGKDPRVVVRELEWQPPSGKGTPRVDPDFELYAGLETNRPRLVPLRIQLYADTPAGTTYGRELDELYRRVMEGPTDESGKARDVVVVDEHARYDLLRDVCRLHGDTSLDYTLVIQVDECWSKQPSFRTAGPYLETPVTSKTDPFTLYGGSQTKGQAFVDGASRKEPYRIPYTWDFGFLVARERAWQGAIGATTASKEERENISAVWDKMKKGEPTDWSDFLRAACRVASSESSISSPPVPPLDLAMMAPESFSCLLLEIWLSEICKSRPHAAAQFVMDLEDGKLGLLELLSNGAENRADRWPSYSRELYMAWLLLVESLDLDSFRGRTGGFGFQPGHVPSPRSVAVRHWYSTAVAAQAQHGNEEVVRFCRLPGTFVVRGDWFLAVAAGSRSTRLADRAIDLLSSRAANVERLSAGIGLPTRHLGVEGDLTWLTTGLRGYSPPSGNDGNGHSHRLKYPDVVRLGAGPGNGTHWLWRSHLKEYDAQMATWQMWQYRMLRRWHRLRAAVGSNWRSGFSVYDAMRKGGEDPDVAVLPSYVDFPDRVNELVRQLRVIESRATAK